MDVEIVQAGGWVYYVGPGSFHEDGDGVGKWMFFFGSDVEHPSDLCQKAVESGVVNTAKHTDAIRAAMRGSGVACFYLNIDDMNGHKRVIEFFLEHDLIRRTKAGRLYNISFKLDDQTKSGKYGNDFKSKLTLDQLVDLNTGEWIADV